MCHLVLCKTLKSDVRLTTTKFDPRRNPTHGGEEEEGRGGRRVVVGEEEGGERELEGEEEGWWCWLGRRKETREVGWRRGGATGGEGDGLGLGWVRRVLRRVQCA